MPACAPASLPTGPAAADISPPIFRGDLRRSVSPSSFIIKSIASTIFPPIWNPKLPSAVAIKEGGLHSPVFLSLARIMPFPPLAPRTKPALYCLRKITAYASRKKYCGMEVSGERIMYLMVSSDLIILCTSSFLVAPNEDTEMLRKSIHDIIFFISIPSFRVKKALRTVVLSSLL